MISRSSRERYIEGEICILDFEASGLHQTSYPIEVAIYLRGKVHCWLIQPQPDWLYWCETAESMHGITRAEIETHGQGVGIVAQELIQAVKSVGAIYTDAVKWDQFWLDRLFDAANLDISLELKSIFSLLTSRQADNFVQRKDELAESGRFRHHRAGEDVKMIFEAYKSVAIEA